MPFASERQRRFLFSRKPEVAREFANKTPRGADLPERVKKRRKKKRVFNRA